MKKITAFFIAFVLFAGTVFGIHTAANRNLNFHNPDFGYWTNDQKFHAPEAVRQNLNPDSLVVFASSELQHGTDTPYHPKNMFKGNTFQPMLIGAGYYQSLSHAITLAALEPSMKKKKVVLMVSPQWFRKKGVLPKAFASRFSESSYLDMLDNPKLSGQTKAYMAKRSVALLSEDPAMQTRVKDYESLYLNPHGNPALRFKSKLYISFLKEKEKQTIITSAMSSGIHHNSRIPLYSEEPDWDSYMQKAEEDAKQATAGNDFQIDDTYFNRKLKPHLAERKGSSKTSSYSESPEYDDLTCFLNVCQELDIEPMLILLPVNGKWYDYTEFPKERRDMFYQNVKEIAAKYPNVSVTDYADQDYTDYFMEDTIHIGWKGWVNINEVLYKFGTET